MTVISSDLFGQDDYIKRYLENPDLPFITVIKIGLRYYVIGDLILQLDELKNYLESTNSWLFHEVFGNTKKAKTVKMNFMCLLCNLPQTIYCERGISNAFWAEPVNALTNVAFPIAGYLGHKLLREKKIKSKELLVLPWMLAIVGFGSFAYHTARNSITLIFDALPIYFFILYALFLTLKELLGSKLKASLLLTGFITLEVILSVYVPREFLNGSIRHIVAIIFVSLIGWFAVKQYGRGVLKPLAGVLALYALAIFFRSIDVWVCSWFPMGTHFLWHILAAFAGYQAIYLLAVIKSSKH